MQSADFRIAAKAVREGIAPLVDFLYPPRCPVCGAGIMDQGGLCTDCWGRLELPAEGSEAGIVAATKYNDVSRQLVLALKHGGRISLAGMMARLIAARLPETCADTVFVPVPLHRWRLWKRGYNQAALIAGDLARLRGGGLAVDGLRRLVRTPSLGGMGAQARRDVLAGSIAVSPRTAARIAERTIILVDDVFTSGATSGECVKVLRHAGAAQVIVACFAKVE